MSQSNLFKPGREKPQLFGFIHEFQSFDTVSFAVEMNYGIGHIIHVTVGIYAAWNGQTV